MSASSAAAGPQPAGRGVEDPASRTVAAVVAAAGTDPVAGLTGAEAAGRLARFGPNELTVEEETPSWRRLLDQLADPVVYLLLAAIVISLVAWWAEGADGVPYDAVVVAAVVVANAAIGFVQEERASRAVAALRDLTRTEARVIRDGERRTIAAADLVPGDVVELADGDLVPADARLVETATLRVAEATLTGESVPVVKGTGPVAAGSPLGDRSGMVFSGTEVVSGRGRGVVTATGLATEVGRIAALLEATEDEDTPLQREIDRVGRLLGTAVVVIAVVVVATLVVVSDLRSAEELVGGLLIGVSLAVAAVPEGLPAVLSVVLALGVQRMSRRNALVKQLASVETLGSASVICTDKTGTLTRNEMMVRRLLVPSAHLQVGGHGYGPTGSLTPHPAPGAPAPGGSAPGGSGLDAPAPGGSASEASAPDGSAPGAPVGGGSADDVPAGDAGPDGDAALDGAVLDEVRWALLAGQLASDGSVEVVEGRHVAVGDPTEAAICAAGPKAGLDRAELERRFTRKGENPFTAERKLMSTVVVDVDDPSAPLLAVKGAPDVLLGRCRAERREGRVVPLDDERRAWWSAAVEEMAGDALRTLGVAYRPVGDDEVSLGEEAERDLILLGVLGIIDPPRGEVAAAIGLAHHAGIRVMMITGDHPVTAVRIAAELGIVDVDAPHLSGPEIEAMSDEELSDRTAEVSVYARVSPEHKLRIVRALGARGEIVAMTGDGVNDAPALKAADIGVAMGITGTEVSKEAADMILTDDDFATIVAAVTEGRAIFHNIRTFLRYLLSSNIGEVLTVFLGVVGAHALGLRAGADGVVAPLLATQILWINLITDSAPALALGVDPPAPGLMDRRPRRSDDRVIDARMQGGIGLIGLTMAAATLLMLDSRLPGGLIDGGRDLATARTGAFTVLVLTQLLNTINARSDTETALRGVTANRWLLGAVALSLVLQIAVVHLPVLNRAFGTAPLPAVDWVLAVALAASVLVVSELRKLVLRRRTPTEELD